MIKDDEEHELIKRLLHARTRDESEEVCNVFLNRSDDPDQLSTAMLFAPLESTRILLAAKVLGHKARSVFQLIVIMEKVPVLTERAFNESLKMNPSDLILNEYIRNIPVLIIGKLVAEEMLRRHPKPYVAPVN